MKVERLDVSRFKVVSEANSEWLLWQSSIRAALWLARFARTELLSWHLAVPIAHSGSGVASPTVHCAACVGVSGAERQTGVCWVGSTIGRTSARRQSLDTVSVTFNHHKAKVTICPRNSRTKMDVSGHFAALFDIFRFG